MTTPKQPLVLSDVDRLKVQSAFFKLIHNAVITDSYGNAVRTDGISELTINDIHSDNDNYVIEYIHDAPSFQSPTIMRLPKHQLGIYFTDDIISIFLQEGQA